MSEQRPMKHPHPTPNIPRPPQPRPNPTPNMTPEAEAAAKKAKAAAATKSVTSMISGAFQKGTRSTEQSQPGSGAALADKRDQAKKLKADY